MSETSSGASWKTPTENRMVIDSQSIGVKRVGVTFNPSGDDRVDSIKVKAAMLINEINDLSLESENGEAKRCFAVAMTDIESAAMWAVKGITKK